MADRHPLARFEALALIAVGGFAGSNLRLLATEALPDVAAVVLVNAVGSFVLGGFVYEAAHAGVVSRRSRLLLTTGVLSSLSTYSTFALQTALSGSPAALAAIVVANYALGFAGVLASRALVRRLAGDSRPTTGGETA